jgi:Queuosine biosynthesis protein
MATLAVLPGLEAFELPTDLEAGSPPEARGLRRDEVRLLVARKTTPAIEHRYFADLPALLGPGDVLVINTSATLPASLPATAAGEPAALQISGRLPGGLWVVELRHRHLDPADEGYQTRPWLDAGTGTVANLPGGGRAVLRIPAAAGLATGRLWVASLELPEPVLDYLARHGYPVRYSYVNHPWPIEAYQAGQRVALTGMSRPRSSLLCALKTNGEATAEGLADELGLTVAAVRQQLAPPAGGRAGGPSRRAFWTGPPASPVLPDPGGKDVLPQTLRPAR